MRTTITYLITLALGAASVSEGQMPETSTAIDVTPIHAEAAVATNDIAGLHDRVRALCQRLRNDSHFAQFVPMGFEIARNELKRCTGLKTVNSRGSAAWVFWGTEGRPFEHSSIAMPVLDLNAAADELSVDSAQLQAGDILKRAGKLEKGLLGVKGFGKVALWKKHLWFGPADDDLKRAQASPALRTWLAVDEVERFSRDGLVFYMRPDAINNAQESMASKLARPFIGRDLKPKEFKFAVWSMDVRDGWGSSLAIHFDGKEVTDALERLSKGRRPADLAGLPNGKVIAASSFAFGDSTTEVLNDIVREMAKPLTEWKAFSDVVSRQNMENIFDVLIQSFRGVSISRFAAYLNRYPGSDGLVSAVTILDTDDAELYVAELASMEQFVNAAFAPSEDRSEVDETLIDELIDDLSADTFRVRQLAYVKLKLVGRLAVPKLELAAKSRDPEVRYRALTILKELQSAAPGQLEQLNRLETSSLSRLGLRFSYASKQEMIAEHPVAHIRIRIDESDPESTRVSKQMESMLGPGWRTIRLITWENKVVAFWGSDMELLEQTVRNLKMNLPGLAEAPQLAAFRKRANAATVSQVHLSLAQIAHLLPGAIEGTPIVQAESAVSLGIGLTPDRIRLDLHLGSADLSVGLRQYTASRSR